MIRTLPAVVVVAALAVAPASGATKPKKRTGSVKTVRRPPPPVLMPPPVPIPPVYPMPPAPMPVPPSVPMPPDPPAPDNPPGEAARPVGSPGGWVGSADYPPEARRAGETGRVVFRLALDRLGRPYRCWVVRSSGSPRLDATTCYLMQSRAKFRPATGLDGKPMEWTYQLSMRWQIEDEVEDAPAVAPPPPTPQKRVVKRKIVRKGTRR